MPLDTAKIDVNTNQRLINAFRRAERRLQKGWNQHRYTDKFDNPCIVAAVGKATFVRSYNFLGPMGDLMIAHLWQNLPPDFQRRSGRLDRRYRDVIRFNDHPNTTQQDVLRVIQKTIVSIS